MRKLLLVFFVSLMSLSLLMTDAEARRFGGGRSFGAYRNTQSFSRSYQPARPQSWQQPQRSTGNRWLAPLAGLALGGLLASLFMGNGIFNGMMTWFLVAAGAFLVLRLLRQLFQPKMQTQHAPYAYNMQNTGHSAPQSNNSYAYNAFKSANNTTFPPDFQEDEFLRVAKVQFIRLQAAYDNKNLEDIRKFTSEEVFAEIKMQLHERGAASNVTEITSLDAKLLDVVMDADKQMASVHFSGLIKEDQTRAPESFDEIWHFIQVGDAWITTGVQQN